MQDEVETGERRYRKVKVKGAENLADILTEVLTGDEITNYPAKISMEDK